MTGRPPTRSSVSRDEASSPPTKSGQRVAKPKSSATRASRATRSQSRDLDDKDASKSTRKSARPRSTRQESVDSVGSNASTGSKGGRKRKQTRAVTAIGDLSTVAEEKEREKPTEDEPTDAKDNSKVFQSPGAMSNLSGTTALTTQSVQKMADLDKGMIVEVIPDLLRESHRLLELLAPANASSDDIVALVKELQVPGSGRGKRLRHRERTFDNTKENYTSELFINPHLILRKLFNDEEIEVGDFMPDPILYAANVATLIKELLVAQRDNPNTMELLQGLDEIFPNPFLSAYETQPRFGSSALRHATSDLALEIRTQTIIATLKAYRDETNFDPDQLLAQIFFDTPGQRNETLSVFEDSVVNGRRRKLAGISFESTVLGEEKFKNSVSRKIMQRMNNIREGLRLEEDDIDSGDYVDFDYLDDRFAWNHFLVKVVQWSQLRIEEINESIQGQGGLENITSSLAEKMKSLDSQIELFYEPLKAYQPAPQAAKNKPSLLPAATIIASSGGKSMYNSSRALKGLSLPKKLAPPSSAPPSNQQAGAAFSDNRASKSLAEPKTPLRQATTRSGRASAPERLADLTFEQAQDEQHLISDNSGAKSKAQMIAHFYDGERYDHKENTPIIEREIPEIKKPRFVDPQPNAERVVWSPSQQSDDTKAEHQGKRGGKRKYQAAEVELEIEEDEVDEDEVGEDENGEVEDDDNNEAFVQDQRPIDTSRRIHAARQVSQPRHTNAPANSSRQSPPRNHNMDEFEDAQIAAALRHREKRRRVEREREREEQLQDQALQASARAADELPSSTPYLEVNETAKVRKLTNTRRVIQIAPRGRQPWTLEETELLIDLIGKIGCSWSAILKKGAYGFSDARDQVSLKDKARNIKVDYLLSGTELPLNFDGVALGRKEKDRVRAGGMNPYRLEGEVVGEESHAMDEDVQDAN